jgi:hypothetical protein
MGGITNTFELADKMEDALQQEPDLMNRLIACKVLVTYVKNMIAAEMLAKVMEGNTDVH